MMRMIKQRKEEKGRKSLMELVDEYLLLDEIYKEIEQARNELKSKILEYVEGKEGVYSGRVGKLAVEKVLVREYDPFVLFQLVGNDVFKFMRVENGRIPKDIRMKLDERAVKEKKEFYRVSILK